MKSVKKKKMASHSEKCKFDGIEDQNEKVAAVESSPTENIAISPTTLLDLNDDCLREMCEHLDLRHLINLADVCHRFREVAQAHFHSMQLMEITKLVLEEEYLPIHRLIRNFGKSISSLEGIRSDGRSKFLIETIMLYCGETLHTLTLDSFEIDEELGQKMRPLLLRLQTFGIIDCRCPDLFFKMLPSCLPELRKLELKSKTIDDWGFIQTYPKLETLSIGYLNEKQFEEFLKKNQQLKSIELDTNCRGDVYFNIIIEHLPTIECLNIFVPSRPSKHWRTAAAAVHRLNALKKLVIKGCSDLFIETLRSMAVAEIPLECLALFNNRYHKGLVDVITQFENLKTLQLVDLLSIKSWHLLKTAKQLGQLTEFHLQSTRPWLRLWSKFNFLEFIEGAKRLQKLYYFEDRCNWNLDEDTFMKIVDIVASREETTHLEINLVHDRVYPPHYVRKEIRNEHKHLISYKAKKAGKINEYKYGNESEFTSEEDSDSSEKSNDLNHSDCDSDCECDYYYDSDW